MLNVLRVLLNTCYVALGCCLFCVESSNVRVESSNDGSYSTNDTDKKAREGHGVSIQFDKHQEVIRHKIVGRNLRYLPCTGRNLHSATRFLRWFPWLCHHPRLQPVIEFSGTDYQRLTEP